MKKSINLLVGAVTGLPVGILSTFELQVILGVFSFICWIVLMSGIPRIDSSDIKRMLFYFSASGLPVAWLAFVVAR